MAGGRSDWDSGVKEEKRRDDDGGKDKKGIFGGLIWNWEFALTRTNAWTGPRRVFLGWTPPCVCASVPVCLPPRRVKKTGFGECRSSVANLAKSERLGGERRQDFLFAASSQCDIKRRIPPTEAGKGHVLLLEIALRENCLCAVGLPVEQERWAKGVKLGWVASPLAAVSMLLASRCCQ